MLSYMARKNSLYWVWYYLKFQASSIGDTMTDKNGDNVLIHKKLCPPEIGGTIV